ncbi:MAG: alpha/beta hydrolase [Pseudomonadota bacterium]
MAISEILVGASLAGAAAAVTPFVVERLRPVRPNKADAPAAGKPGHRTHYRWLGPGDGPVAVCIHGLTTPSFVWEAFAPELVRKGYRVLLYDLYGRGCSDYPDGLQSGAYFADQLDELLNNLKTTEPVLVLGYSMGGAIAATFAAKHPDRVRKLVLIAPAGFGHDLGAIPKISAKLPLLGGALMRLVYPSFSRNALETDRNQNCVVENMIDRQIAETRWRGFAPAVWSSIRGVLSEDLAPSHRRIATLGIPTLIVWGEKDDVIPLKGMEHLDVWNSDASSVLIPNAGHGIPYTHLSELVSACETVLSC